MVTTLRPARTCSNASRLVGVELLDAARRQRGDSRSSVPSGYGANEAVTAGRRCAAVTIGIGVAAPAGAARAVSRDNAS